MTEWIIPWNPSMYKADEAFKDLKVIDWRRTNNTKNIKDGDIVYLYASKPLSRITYKGAILKAYKPKLTIDDSVYSIPPGNLVDGECMEIALFREYEIDGLDFNTLKDNGLTSNLQGAVRVNPNLANYLHACDNIQRKVDRFMGDIPDVCLVPFPIPINEIGIDKNIPLSPAKVSEDGEIITCRNCNENFRKARRCTFCGQLIAYKEDRKESNSNKAIKYQNDFEENGITGGGSLYSFLEESGINDMKKTSIDTNNNVIRLPHFITMNWKKDKIRVNCKISEMEWIEAKTGFKHFDNGSGDPTHPYSFFINSFEELNIIINAIKQI